MKGQKFVYGLAVLGLLFFGAAKLFPIKRGPAIDNDMVRGAEIMGRAIDAVRHCAESRGIPIDPRTDINRTGLIGPEYSAITTSLGNLEAKRTTTNPNFGGLLVKILKEAGVRRGDAIAIGASGSFPALIIASLSAAQALSTKPVMIASLGASNWGASDPDFTWLDMLECLKSGGVLDASAAAVSLGGEDDIGMDMPEGSRAALSRRIREAGVFFLQEPDLEKNVAARMRIYEENAAPAKIRAFINVGGSRAGIGTDSSVLTLKPGIAIVKHIPPKERRGVIQEMALAKIPVIHLLFIKGLTERYGLPWDPVPLPKPGEGRLFAAKEHASAGFLTIAGIYILITIGVLARFRALTP
jgi:poly-gamma-glutamate system protein